jgi:hypothetical protein
VTFCKAEVSDYEYKAILAKGISWEKAVTRPVHPATRERFAKSWGISVDRQLAMERDLDSPKLPTRWDPAKYEETVPDGRSPWSRLL